MTRSGRLAYLGAVMICVLVALTACPKEPGPTSAALLAYRVGPGANEITVIYGVRPGDGAGSAEVLSEDSQEVTVRVMYLPSTREQEERLQYREVVATLEAPLGERKVIDDAGLALPPR